MQFCNTDGIRKDSDFRKVYQKGKSFADRNLVIYIMKNNTGRSRLGISVSKKVGKANVRNKVRRRIKEAYRLYIDKKVKSGYDIVIIARVNSPNSDFKEIVNSLKYISKKVEVVYKGRVVENGYTKKGNRKSE